MRSLVLRTSATVLHPVLILFSIFLLIRGHDEPGGGFSGGLVAATAYVFLAAAHDLASSRRLLRVPPRALLGTGLGLALVVGLFPVVQGLPFLSAMWWERTLPLWGSAKLGTPVAFDVGVYLTVLGATLTIFFALMEE